MSDIKLLNKINHYDKDWCYQYQKRIDTLDEDMKHHFWTQSDIDNIQLKDFEFDLPPVELQQKLVELLWAMEDTKAAYKDLIAKSDEFVKSQFIELFGDVDENTNSFPILKWNDVFRTKTGKLDSNAMVKGGQYPFFTCAKEIYWIDRFAFDCEALLLAGNNAVGVYDVKHYKGRFNAYQRTYVLQLLNEEWSYIFFKAQLEQKLEYLRINSIGSNTRYLTMKILGEIKFIVPEIEKQNQYAEFVKQLDKSKFEAKQALEYITAAQKTLMRQHLGN